MTSTRLHLAVHMLLFYLCQDGETKNLEPLRTTDDGASSRAKQQIAKERFEKERLKFLNHAAVQKRRKELILAGKIESSQTTTVEDEEIEQKKDNFMNYLSKMGLTNRIELGYANSKQLLYLNKLIPQTISLIQDSSKYNLLGSMFGSSSSQGTNEKNWLGGNRGSFYNYVQPDNDDYPWACKCDGSDMALYLKKEKNFVRCRNQMDLSLEGIQANCDVANNGIRIRHNILTFPALMTILIFFS